VCVSGKYLRLLVILLLSDCSLCSYFSLLLILPLRYIRSVREQIMRSRGCQQNGNGSSGGGGGGSVDIPMVVVANKHDLPDNPRLSKREVAGMVKKQWKCPYIECSATHNWHIVSVFKELMKAVDMIDHTAQQRHSSERGQNARARCVIL
jgi:GTPase SAR1 family protein